MRLLTKRVLILALAMMFTVTMGLVVFAMPQTTNFIYKYGLWYDSWGYTRNEAIGPGGFVPNLAYEVLGQWQGIAFEWGTQFAEKYSDKIQRAEAILSFVQQRTEYGYDEDNVIIGGEFQEEWAWNGDEIASKIDFVSNSPAIGDCEDLAFFCSAIYEGAGFDTVMVLTTDHVALLIWLPNYPNVIHWDLEGDGRDYGWIWIESTGENNPVGWTPNAYRDGYWDSYVIERLYIHNIQFSPAEPRIEDDVTVTASILHTTSKVDKITLRYFLESQKNEVDMESVDTIKYQALIPKQKDGAVVEFEIVVTDEDGNLKQSDLLSYQVANMGFTLPNFLNNSDIIALLTNAGIIIVILIVIVILLIAL